MTMSNYIGKHLLIDCYGCKADLTKGGTELFRFLFSDDGPVKIEVDDTYIHETDDEGLWLHMPHECIFVSIYIRIWLTQLLICTVLILK